MDRTLACGAGDRGSNPLGGTKIGHIKESRTIRFGSDDEAGDSHISLKGTF